MQAILAVTIPFFALVLCGYVAAHRHVLRLAVPAPW
ncbi:MAG: AEC family transporter, partial [Betaproteobacteria bacterium]